MDNISNSINMFTLFRLYRMQFFVTFLISYSFRRLFVMGFETG